MPFFGGLVAETGIYEAPSQGVLDEHLYCCHMEGGICDDGEIPLSRLAECKLYHEKKLATRKRDASRLKVPIMISEWGACSDSLACATELNNVQDVMDEYAASWAYWQMKDFGDFTTVSDSVQGIYDVETGGF